MESGYARLDSIPTPLPRYVDQKSSRTLDRHTTLSGLRTDPSAIWQLIGFVFGATVRSEARIGLRPGSPKSRRHRSGPASCRHQRGNERRESSTTQGGVRGSNCKIHNPGVGEVPLLCCDLTTAGYIGEESHRTLCCVLSSLLSFRFAT